MQVCTSLSKSPDVCKPKAPGCTRAHHGTTLQSRSAEAMLQWTPPGTAGVAAGHPIRSPEASSTASELHTWAGAPAELQNRVHSVRCRACNAPHQLTPACQHGPSTGGGLHSVSMLVHAACRERAMHTVLLVPGGMQLLLLRCAAGQPTQADPGHHALRPAVSRACQHVLLPLSLEW